MQAAGANWRPSTVGARLDYRRMERSKIWTTGLVRMFVKAVVKEGRMTLSCHHRGISRLKAEDLLLGSNEDGRFLVRDSETIIGAYTLCVLYQGNTHQYRILPDGEGSLYMQAGKGGMERKYVDLVQLIHETVQKNDKNGLICALKYPVPVEVDEDEKDSDDDEEHEKLPVTEKLSSSSARDFPDRASVEMITAYFNNRLTSIDLSEHGSDFLCTFRDYSDEGVHRDLADISAGAEEMKQLRQLVSDSARELDKHLDIFLSKLDCCQQLFGYPSSLMMTQKSSCRKSTEPKTVELAEVLEKCSQCKPLVSNLEKKALKTLQDLRSKQWESEGPEDNTSRSSVTGKPRLNIAQTDSDPPSKKTCKIIIPPMTYKARLVKHGKPATKMNLMVDIQAGKFFAVRTNHDSLDDTNVFFHDKVEQVIKCTANNCRLDIKIEGRKKETYIFDDVYDRENFCQMIHELKSFHASSHEVDHLSVFIGSWNMGSDVPPLSLGSWLKSQGLGKTRSRAVGLIPHDLYVIGTQESSLTEKDWVNRIKASLQETLAYDVHDMHTVTTVSMWSLRLVVLVRADYKNKITHVQHSTVKTGIANTLGNKGAIGVSFYFDGTALCFVNAHLTSGHERNTKRNQNVVDIIKGLDLSPVRTSGGTSPLEWVVRNQNVHDIIKGLSLGSKSSSVFDITNQFHHVFFFGDLNYRLDSIDPNEVVKAIAQKRASNSRDYESLLEYDQLHKSQARKEAFCGFNEEEITFPPTYRFEKGSLDRYSWQKVKKTGIRINAPSWCDRVIWKSYPETYIRSTSYGYVEDVKTSDHKPLFSSFDVGIISHVVSPKGKQLHCGNALIVFQEITAEVKTTTKEFFRLEFYSTCLACTAESEQNDVFDVNSQQEQYVCPKWTVLHLPRMIPMFDDRDYLEDQHIIISVKTSDGMESFGECVIALKSMFSVKSEPFQCYLTHKGEATGRIKGLMHVSMGALQPANYNYRRRKSYELICLDTEMPVQLLSQVSSPASFQDIHEEEFDGAGQRLSLLRSNATKNRPPAQRQSKGLSDTTSSASTDSEPSGTSPGKDAANGNPPSEPAPAIPVRKPRLGQSSLATSSVLPVVASRASNNNNNNGTSAPAVPARNLDENSNSRRHGTHQTFRNLPIVPDSQDTADVPPPLKPRRKPKTDSTNVQMSYEALRKPSTINEWLLDLGLPQYIPFFYDQGWDELQYIGSISPTDLVAMKIHNEEHRQRIMRSVQDMMHQ